MKDEIRSTGRGASDGSISNNTFSIALTRIITGYPVIIRAFLFAKNILLPLFEGICVAYGFCMLVSDVGHQLDWLVMWIIILGYCYIYAHGLPKAKTYKKFITVNILSAIFSTLIVLCSGRERMSDLYEFKYRAAMAIAGLFFFFRITISYVYILLDKCGEMATRKADNIVSPQKSKKYFIISFLALFFVYSFYLLCVYPGSYSVDVPDQMYQILGYKPYNNLNPLINTLTIGLFVKTSFAVGGDINFGIALYCFFQYTIFSIVYACLIKLLYEYEYSKTIICITFLIFILPHSIVYAVQMWKDSMASILIMILYLLLWRIINEQRCVIRYACLIVFVVLTCFSRATAWPSVSVLGIACLFSSFLEERNVAMKMRISAGFIAFGVILHLAIVHSMPVFDVGVNTWAYSLPEQQINAVLVSGCLIDEEDMDLLVAAEDVEAVKQNFEAANVDPTAVFVDRNFVYNHFDDFKKLYVRWWIKYPGIFVNEFISMTKIYLNPLSSVVLWATEIYENDFGIYRNKIINIDLREFLNFLSHSFIFQPFERNGFYLWAILIACGYLLSKKRYTNMLFYMPMLSHIGIYILTGPVAMFRYIYPVTILLPLIYIWALTPSISKWGTEV